jgi:hypothetical protein
MKEYAKFKKDSKGNVMYEGHFGNFWPYLEMKNAVSNWGEGEKGRDGRMRLWFKNRVDWQTSIDNFNKVSDATLKPFCNSADSQCAKSGGADTQGSGQPPKPATPSKASF